MRRISVPVAAVVAALAAGVALASCAKEEEPIDLSSLDLIRTDTSEPQHPLIPADTYDVPGSTVIDLIFSGLVYLDENGKPHNDMAESITQTGPKTYDVVIKEDAAFSDGSSVTARDFVDTWNTAVRQSMLSSINFEPILGYSEGKENMRGLTVTGKKTFTIELSQPVAGFELRLGSSVFFPMKSSSLKDLEKAGKEPIGSGPYMLAEWKPYESITVVPNPEYEGDRKARNEGIQFVVYPDESTAYQDLLSGELDVLTHIPAEKVGTFHEELGSRAVNHPAAVMNEITIPANATNFRGKAGTLRRRAISMAIDREAIARDVLHGTVTPAQGFIAPFDGSTVPNPVADEAIGYNPGKARELWAQADALAPFQGDFTISYNTDGSHKAWVDALSAQLSQTLGINAYGKPLDTFKELRDEITSHRMTGAFRTSWQAEYPSEESFLAPLFSSDSTANESGYSNKEFDRLLEKAVASETVEGSHAAFSEAQDLLLETMPAIPLWYSNSVGGYGEDIAPLDFSWKSKPLFYQIQRQ